MRYIKNFNKFKSKYKLENFHFYEVGKSSKVTIFESGLISEGFSTDKIQELSNRLDFRQVDKMIIESLFENFDRETFVLEEYEFLNNLWNTTKSIWSSGMKLFGDIYTNFTDFLKNIGKVIGNLFKKIGEMFKSLWGLMKTGGLSFIQSVKGSVVGNLSGESIKTTVEIIGDEDFSVEMKEMSSDLNAVKSRFLKGNLGNKSDELKSKLEKEAEDYDGVDNLEDLGKFIGESYNLFSKSNFRKIYYCLKGYVVEGNNINDLIFEDNESEDERDEKKVKGKMGVMGWFVEAIKLILKPMDWLMNQALRLGVNGCLMMVSSLARGGWNSKYNYKKFGKSIIKVKDLVESGEGGEQSIPEGTEDSLEEAEDISKSKKLKAVFSDLGRVLGPIFGAVLVKCLESQLGPVISILKWILLTVGVFEMVKILCQKNLVKGQICSFVNFQL